MASMTYTVASEAEAAYVRRATVCTRMAGAARNVTWHKADVWRTERATRERIADMLLTSWNEAMDKKELAHTSFVFMNVNPKPPSSTVTAGDETNAGLCCWCECGMIFLQWQQGIKLLIAPPDPPLIAGWIGELRLQFQCHFRQHASYNRGVVRALLTGCPGSFNAFVHWFKYRF